MDNVGVTEYVKDGGGGEDEACEHWGMSCDRQTEEGKEQSGTEPMGCGS